MVNILDKFKVNVSQSEIEFVRGAFYSKLHFKSTRMRKPLKVVSNNPMVAINSSLAAGKKVSVNKGFMASMPDITDEYTNLKMVIGQLWPLPTKFTSTESLKVLSEFIDQTQNA
jgi:hypothetical protein